LQLQLLRITFDMRRNCGVAQLLSKTLQGGTPRQLFHELATQLCSTLDSHIPQVNSLKPPVTARKSFVAQSVVVNARFEPDNQASSGQQRTCEGADSLRRGC
jgi:hypothetical protein